MKREFWLFWFQFWRWFKRRWGWVWEWWQRLPLPSLPSFKLTWVLLGLLAAVLTGWLWSSPTERLKLAVSPTFVKTHKRTMIAAVEAGDFRLAEQLYGALERQKADSPLLQELEVKVFPVQVREKRLEMIEKALKLQPAARDLLWKKLILLLELKRFEAAARVWTRAWELDPNDTANVQALSQLLDSFPENWQKGLREKAVE